MTQWKLTLSYDGTGFHGWQVQPALRTVQGTLAEALHRVTGETVLPQGSGRTDAGVHALAQTASFPLVAPIPPTNLLRALNSVLPSSIRVLAAEHVAPDFHARHSALRKTYEYRIFQRSETAVVDPSSALHRDEWGTQTSQHICPPFLAPFVWDCRWPLDLRAMHDAASCILGEHDFASFAAADPDRSTRGNPEAEPLSTVRTVFASTLSSEAHTIVYRITGNGFLHHMVRNIVGTLVEVGRGALTPDAIDRIVASRDRSDAGPTAPASGLFLVSVEYPPSHAEAQP